MIGHPNRVRRIIEYLSLLWRHRAEVRSSLLRDAVELYCRERVQTLYQLPAGLPTVNILDVTGTLDVTIHPYSYLEGTSPTIDLAFLKSLCSLRPGCDYMEIGTWRGESIVNCAAVARSCTAVSLSDEELRSMGVSESFIANSRIYMKDLPNAAFIGANSLTFDFNTLHRKFDVIFVDGDHSYDTVRNDTRKVFSLLRDEDSVIIWHDYTYTPETVRWSVLAAILDGAPPEARNHLYHVSNTMCAMYSRRPLASHTSVFPSGPTADFSIRITARAQES